MGNITGFFVGIFSLQIFDVCFGLNNVYLISNFEQPVYIEGFSQAL